MEALNMVETPKELLDQAKQHWEEKQFSSTVVERLAEAMNFKDDCNMSVVGKGGDAALVLTSGTHNTNGQDSLRSLRGWLATDPSLCLLFHGTFHCFPFLSSLTTALVGIAF